MLTAQLDRLSTTARVNWPQLAVSAGSDITELCKVYGAHHPKYKGGYMSHLQLWQHDSTGIMS